MSNLDKAGRLLRLMGWISLIGVIGIFAAIIIPVISTGEKLDELFVLSIIAILALAIPAIYLTTGSAIKKDKKWGKVAGTIIAALSLLNIPIGTIFGIATLYYLKKGWSEASEDA